MVGYILKNGAEEFNGEARRCLHHAGVMMQPPNCVGRSCIRQSLFAFAPSPSMDSDRRSNVSSFYGNKPNPSFNPNAAADQDARSPFDTPPTSGRRTGPHDRKDSTTSSFFNPRNSSTFDPAAPNYAFRSAPSRSTHEEPRYAKDDEEVEAGWDVYADFNNAGPRYAPFPGKSNSSSVSDLSLIFFSNFAHCLCSGRYRPIGGSKPEPLAPAQDPNTPGVELVTVPALGAEWKADELKAMTKRGRREAKNDERQRKWKDWNRDNTACCGGYVTRRRVVWGLFGTIIVVGVLLAFMIPRAPPFAFIGNSPLVAVDGGSFEYTRIPPANFSFASTAMLEGSSSTA